MNAKADTEKAKFDELNRFLDLIRSQDDRALVLSLASFMEESLGRLLLSYFRDCKQTRELVEGFNAPLGTLGSRIKAAYAFGLVCEQQYRDMDIVRKVRNTFAHDWEGVSIERNDIKALIGQLSGYTVDHKPPSESPRQKLHDTAATICMELQIFAGRLHRGEMLKAADHSFRLTVIPPKGAFSRRYVT
ncbi:hypothetical protein LMG19089_04767 [Ralstonia edaphis]|uniref:hypothetical protein n=1 Tax=Ralstonia edaphi TaxID=3058599 RepID=UPI0028F6BB0C|nr:hypothetical protein [Ralstonia sp. LMG 6871]CAJ0708773.1 hypothetical protein LMG19089_04767 [Ralstonia sp. LMG 6871]